MQGMCSTCKFSRKEYDDILSCKKTKQDMYITQGWGVEFCETVKADDSCDKWEIKSVRKCNHHAR